MGVPFMHPIDVEGLGLDDYYEVIDKPTDYTTVKNQMEAKDGTGYKNVREICADVRLVFKNAMTYNDDRNDVHVMAKTLLAKFEEKWLLLFPKVIEEVTVVLFMPVTKLGLCLGIERRSMKGAESR